MKEEKIVYANYDWGLLCTIDALGDSEFPEQLVEEVADLFNKLDNGYTLVCHDCVVKDTGEAIEEIEIKNK